MFEERLMEPIIPGESVAGIRLGTSETDLPPCDDVFHFEYGESEPDMKEYRYDGFSVWVTEAVVDGITAQTKYLGDVEPSGIYPGMSWAEAVKRGNLVYDLDGHYWVIPDVDGLRICIASPPEKGDRQRGEKPQASSIYTRYEYYFLEIYEVKHPERAIIESILVE